MLVADALIRTNEDAMPVLEDRWRAVRDAIEADIRSGRLAPGDQLPVEAELARRHGAGRHSVRRAVADLAREGKLSVEQGRGTFVEAAPLIAYAIGARTRLSRNLARQGIEVGGERLDCEVVEARPPARPALRLPEGAEVVASRHLTLADGAPIAVGTIYHDPRRFPGYAERRAALGSVTATYRSYGVEDYLRGQTTLHARAAEAGEARLLRQHRDLPVMVVRATDTLLDGTPISFSEVVWSAVRVRFTFGPEDDDEDGDEGCDEGRADG